MKRRALIRNIFFYSAGVSLLPACIQTDSAFSSGLNQISVTREQENLLAELSEFILPVTTIPGTSQIKSHQFILMMIDDCYKKEDQEKFIKGLNSFDDFMMQKTGKSFQNADKESRLKLLSTIESKKDIPEELQAFYSMTKRLSIQSFTGSKFFLTEIRKYEMVPSRFHGCHPIASNILETKSEVWVRLMTK